MCGTCCIHSLFPCVTSFVVFIHYFHVLPHLLFSFIIFMCYLICCFHSLFSCVTSFFVTSYQTLQCITDMTNEFQYDREANIQQKIKQPARPCCCVLLPSIHSSTETIYLHVCKYVLLFQHISFNRFICNIFFTEFIQIW